MILSRPLQGLLTTIIAILLTIATAHGQNGIDSWISELQETHAFEPVVLFQPAPIQAKASRNMLPVQRLTLDRQQLDQIRLRRPSTFSLAIPVEGAEAVEVYLGAVELFTPDFKVSTKGTQPQQDVAYNRGIFYRGIIKDKPNSVVAVSIFQDEVNALIADDTGNRELIKDPGSGDYFLFDAKSLPVMANFTCDVVSPPGVHKPPSDGNQTSGIGCKTVGMYLECDYQLYQDKGSNTTNVVNYISSLFNQVSALYSNENIDIQVQTIQVWTSIDPYACNNSAANLLYAFRSTLGSNFNGTLAQFLTTRNIGGGIGYLGVLCNKAYAHSVCYIQNTFTSITSYSWSVQVMTHELGHNFGSNHTHWCGWTLGNGSTGALDNCYSTEGGCVSGPTPTNGGTIMSYCHMTTQGINFSNGFGTIPGNLIRNQLINASCVASTGTIPSGLSTSNITASSATLTWNATNGATNYTAQFRNIGSTTWLTVGTTSSTSIALSNLNGATGYEWQVKSDCSGFSNSSVFTTSTVSNCNAPTGLLSSSITGVSAQLTWNTVPGASRYTVQYKKSNSNSWISLTSISSNTTTVSGLNGSTTYTWRVSANCSGNSSTASFTTASSGCLVPVGCSSSNITRSDVRFSWSASPGASTYTIGYKPINSTRWTQVGPQSSTQLNLTGLLGGTTYEWKVKSNCSNYSSPLTFTTLTVLPTWTEKASDEPATLFPNPAHQEVRVTIEADEEWVGPFQIQVNDLLGKTQLQTSSADKVTDLDLSGLAQGVYMIQISDSQDHVFTKRLLKKD